MLFAGWEVRIVKNYNRGLENVAWALRPRAAFSSPRSLYGATLSRQITYYFFLGLNWLRPSWWNVSFPMARPTHSFTKSKKKIQIHLSRSKYFNLQAYDLVLLKQQLHGMMRRPCRHLIVVSTYIFYHLIINMSGFMKTVLKGDNINIKRKVSLFFLTLPFIFLSLLSFLYFLPVYLAWRRPKSLVKLRWNKGVRGRVL